MSFGNILGQMLQQGLAGQKTTHSRVEHAAGSLRGGREVEALLGQLQSRMGGSRSGGGQFNLAEAASGFLRGPQAGGMSGAQIGGLGALAGAVLGRGGMKGAARGGAMAIIGTLALNAIRQARSAQPAGGATQVAGSTQTAGSGRAGADVEDAEVASLASDAGERLALRAMIAAAKADGNIDQTEMDRILGRLDDDEVTPEERQFVLDELRRPLDEADLAREAATPALAAEVYAASLLAIDIDSEAERTYLRRLAEALRLDEASIAYLHEQTGAPRA